MAQPNKKPEIQLIRIIGTDLKANSTLIYGLSGIKGISYMFANAMCHVLKLDKNMKISDLTDKQIEIIEQFLTNPKKEGMPTWLLNSRKNYETGEDLHFNAKDIDFDIMQLKRRLGKIKTYKGLRLRLNLTVRGQRTKSNFRRSKTLAAMKAKSGGAKK